MITAITHRTASIFWRSDLAMSPSSSARRNGDRAAAILLLQRNYPGIKQVELLLRAMPDLPSPYHLLVPSAMHKSKRGQIKYHSISPDLPKGALVELSPNLVSVSPELSFVQYANESVDVVQAVLYGYELCGTYRFNESDRTFQHDLAAVTCREQLHGFLGELQRTHGVKRARKAIKYVRDNSGSYMETALALLWGLPGMCGGCSLPFPDMNFRVDRFDGRPDSSGRSFYLCDLCWPDKKVCVEYDSDSHHGSTEQMAKDSEKRIALAEMGYTVLEMTRQQVMNESSFERFTNVLMDALGEHPRIRVTDYEAKRHQLWRRLLKSYSTYC